MKKLLSKRIIPLILVFCLIFSVSPITIWAVDNVATQSGTATDSYGNTATLEALEDGKFALSFHFVDTYKDGTTNAGVTSGKNTATDTTRLGGIVKYLLFEAVNDYNTKNNTALTAPALGETAKFTDVNYSVTELYVTSAEGKTVDIDLFRAVFPTDGFVNVTKIDMSGMNCLENRLFYQNNFGIFSDQYVIYYVDETTTATIEGAGQKTSCSYPNLTELILPKSLKKLGTSATRGIYTITSLVIPDGVTCLEAYSLRRSGLVTVSLPKSLTYYGTANASVAPETVTESDGTNSPVDNWSYHGTMLTAESWTQLISDINKSIPVTLDFSNSSITLEQLKFIDTTELTYLDVSACGNIVELEEGTTEYEEVMSFIQSLRDLGITVKADKKPDSTYTDSNGNSALLSLRDDGKYKLSLHIVQANLKDGASAGVVNGQNVAQDTTRLAGIVKALFVGAVEKYSNDYDTALTAPALGKTAKFTDVNYSVVELTVSSAEGVTVDMDLFRQILPTDGFVNITKIDMSGMNCVDNKLIYQNGWGLFSDQDVVYYVDETTTAKIEGAGQKTTCSYLNLTDLILPDSLKTLGGSALRGLNALTSIVIPDGVTCLEGSSLQRCDNLKTVTLPKDLVYYGTTNDTTAPVSVTENKRTPVDNWIYHGTALTDASWTQLISDINSNVPVSIDFSGSSISSSLLKQIDISELIELDISNCENINNLDKSSQEYKDVVEFVRELRNRNAIVKTDIFIGDSALDGTYNDDAGNSAAITPLENGKYALSLHFANHYSYSGEIYEVNTSADISKLDGVVRNLLYGAVEEYKSVNNITELSAPLLGNEAKYTDINYSITELTVTSNPDIWVSGYLFLVVLPTDGFVNIEKIDLSGMNYAWDADPTVAKNQNVMGPNNFQKANSGILTGYQYQYYINETEKGTLLLNNDNCVFPNLTEFILPETLTKIEQYDFRSMTKISVVNIPDSVTFLGQNAFRKCHSITEINLPASLETYGKTSEGTYTSALDAANATITSWSFHGQNLEGASFDRLIKDINSKSSAEQINRLDFNGSNITARNLFALNFDNIIYLDIRNCPIDYTTSRGKRLLAMLEEFIANNPEATILYDEGIVGSDYTPVSAEIILSDGVDMAAALADWSATTGMDASTITDIVISTAGTAEMTSADFETLKSTIPNLRHCDFSKAKCVDNTIPANAFRDMEYLKGVKVPSNIEVISEYAFYGTEIESFDMPSTVRVIGDEAFRACYALEGSLVLPYGLEELGSNAFADACFTSLEYHGTLDPNIKVNFAYSASTLEYIDLRGVKAVTYDTLPKKWDSLKEGHFDYCSIEENKIYHDQLWFTMLRCDGVILTALHQFEDYEDLDTMLKETLYGKTDEDYPDDYPEKSNFDFSPYISWNFAETVPQKEITVVENQTSSDSTNDNNGYSNSNNSVDTSDTSIEENNDSDSDNSDNSTTKTVKVRKKRKKVNNNNANTDVNYVPYVIGGSVALVVVAAAVVLLFIVLKKRKNNNRAKEGK